MSRRSFMETGAAGALGLAGLPTSAWAGSASASSARASSAARSSASSRASKGEAKDPFGGFIVGVQSYSFRHFGLEQALTRTRDLGLHFMEFFRGHVPVNSTDDQIRAVRAMCFKYDINPIAFGVESFTSDNAANRRTFEFARKLGVRYLTADPSPDSFDSLDKLVSEFGIGIAIHPHGPQGRQLHRWYSAEVIMQAIGRHHRLIGTCLDTGHLIRSAQNPFNRKLDPAQQVRLMGARNFGLHLKDHDNQKHTDVVYGRGVLNVPEVLRALREVKFQGYISIEYEANENNPSPDMAACLDVFKQSVRKLG